MVGLFAIMLGSFRSHFGTMVASLWHLVGIWYPKSMSVT